MHGGDRVARVLERRGVRFVFTLCGGHVSPILTAAKALGLRVVDVRHEATAVFAADAVARITGVPGVAVVTAGPGVTNTITAVKNAQLAQSPLVLIGGAAPTALKGRGALQDIDQEPLVAPHVKSFRAVRRVRDLAPAIDEAFEAAAAGVPGPAFVECPVDLLYEEKTIREWYRAASGKGKTLSDRALAWYLKRHVQGMFAPGPEYVWRTNEIAVREADESAIAAAREALVNAERPLLLVGTQALACPGEANAIADAVHRLGLPTYLSGMARGLLGPDSPLQHRHRRREALRESDCVILAGVPCDFRLDYGRHIRGSAKLISVNRSAREGRMNRRPDILAVGDAGRFLRALAASGDARHRAGAHFATWLSTLRARDHDRETQIALEASASGELVNPLALCRAIDANAAKDATFIADGGDFVATAAYTVHPRAPLTWLDPGVFGTLGVGAGFALGTKLCRPQDEAWVLWGDGAFGYGLAEYDTFARHGIGVIGVVGNDAGWTQIAREQVKLLGDDVSTVLARTDYHRAIEGLGGAGFLARNDGEVAAALSQARAAARQGRPALVNAWLAPSAFRDGSISM